MPRRPSPPRSAAALGIRKVEKGQYVSAGMALVSLQALDPIRADFPMPEQHIGKLRVGQPVELTVDAYPGQVFKGEIQSLDARVAQDTRTLLVRAILPNKERKLLPGMFANVTVLVGEAADVVTVPRTAVTYSLYGDSVYVVKPAPAEGRRRRPRAAAAGQPAERAAHRRAPLRAHGPGARRTASPSRSASPPASRSSPPASSSSIRGASIRIDNIAAPQPARRRGPSNRGGSRCRSPTFSFAGPCSPAW